MAAVRGGAFLRGAVGRKCDKVSCAAPTRMRRPLGKLKRNREKQRSAAAKVAAEALLAATQPGADTPTTSAPPPKPKGRGKKASGKLTFAVGGQEGGGGGGGDEESDGGPDYAAHWEGMRGEAIGAGVGMAPGEVAVI